MSHCHKITYEELVQQIKDLRTAYENATDHDERTSIGNSLLVAEEYLEHVLERGRGD